MVKKEFSPGVFISKIVLMNVLIVFIWMFFNVFLSITDTMYSSLEITLTAWTFFLVTHYYRKYNNGLFLKKLSLINTRKDMFTQKQFLKFRIFLFSFLYTFILVLFWIMWLRIFNVWGIGSTSIMNPEEVKINWSSYNWNWFLIFSTLEFTAIIIATLFLNKFFKKVSFVYGTIIIFFMYTIIFCSNSFDYGWYEKINNENYFVWNVDGAKKQLTRNAILVPWTIYGVMGKALSSSQDNSLKLHGINMINMNFNGTTYNHVFSYIAVEPFMLFASLGIATTLYEKTSAFN